MSSRPRPLGNVPPHAPDPPHSGPPGLVARALAACSGIFDAAGAAVIAHDRAGRIRYANDLGVANLRTRPNAPREVVGASILDFYLPEEVDPFIERLNEVLDAGEDQVMEYTTDFGGIARTFVTTMVPNPDADGVRELDLVLVIAREVTVERELVDDRVRLLDLLPDVLVEFDERGQVRWAHAPVGKLVFGRTGDQATGASLTDIVGQENAATLAALAEKASIEKLHQTMVLRWPTPHLAPTSAIREYEVRVAAKAAGKALAIIRDISDRTRLEAQLHLAERLASLGRIAAGVVHEVSNPLTYVHGNIELALEELSLLERERPELAHPLEGISELLREAREGGNRLRNIIEDIGLLARPDSMIPQRVDLKSVLRSVVRMLGTSIRKRATLTVKEGPVPFVLGSAPRMTQVMTNLLVNALYALPERSIEDNRITLGLEQSDGHVVIEVTDNGVGIAPEDHARIFEPFFTTKPVGQGMGLGLPISHGIVTAMGGTMRIEGRPGLGTTVRVRLPALTTTADEKT